MGRHTVGADSIMDGSIAAPPLVCAAVVPQQEDLAAAREGAGNNNNNTAEAVEPAAALPPTTNTPAQMMPAEGSAADFECSICSDIVIEPVVGPCGHDFCNACIRKWRTASSHGRANAPLHCPICRAELPTDLGVCHRLKSVMEFCFPEQLERRRQEQALAGAETNNKTQGGLSQVRAPNPVTFEAEVQELQQQRCRRQQQHLELQQLSAELNSVLSPDISALSLWPVDPAQLPHDPQLHARLTGHRSNPLQPQRQQQEDPAAALHESMFAEVQRGLSQRQSSSGSGDGHRVAWLEADHSHSHQGYRGPPGARRCASMGASVGRGHSASFDHNSTNTNSQQQPLRLPPSGPRGASGPLPAPSNPRTAAASNSHPLLSRSPPSHRQAQHPQPNTSSSGLLNSRRSSGVEHTGTAATQMGEGERGSCSLAFASLMDLRALGSSDANSVRTSSHSSLQLPNMLDNFDAPASLTTNSGGPSSGDPPSLNSTFTGQHDSSHALEAAGAVVGPSSTGSSSLQRQPHLNHQSSHNHKEQLNADGSATTPQHLIDAVGQGLLRGVGVGGLGYHSHHRHSRTVGTDADLTELISSSESENACALTDPDALPGTPRAGGQQAAQAANHFFGSFSPHLSGGTSPASSVCGGGGSRRAQSGCGSPAGSVCGGGGSRRAQSPAQGSGHHSHFCSPVSGTSPTHSRAGNVNSPFHPTSNTHPSPASHTSPGNPSRSTSLSSHNPLHTNPHTLSGGLAAWGLWTPHSSLAHASAAQTHHPLAYPPSRDYYQSHTTVPPPPAYSLSTLTPRADKPRTSNTVALPPRSSISSSSSKEHSRPNSNNNNNNTATAGIADAMTAGIGSGGALPPPLHYSRQPIILPNHTPLSPTTSHNPREGVLIGPQSRESVNNYSRENSVLQGPQFRESVVVPHSRESLQGPLSRVTGLPEHQTPRVGLFQSSKGMPGEWSKGAKAAASAPLNPFPFSAAGVQVSRDTEPTRLRSSAGESSTAALLHEAALASTSSEAGSGGIRGNSAPLSPARNDVMGGLTMQTPRASVAPTIANQSGGVPLHKTAAPLPSALPLHCSSGVAVAAAAAAGAAMSGGVGVSEEAVAVPSLMPHAGVTQQQFSRQPAHAGLPPSGQRSLAPKGTNSGSSRSALRSSPLTEQQLHQIQQQQQQQGQQPF